MKQQDLITPEVIITKLTINQAIDTIGCVCREIRKSRKMSVRQLSKSVDICQGAIIKFELGKTDLTSSRLLRIMKHLNIEIYCPKEVQK